MALINTWLTDRFDLDLPVVAATMAGVSDGRFVAAASSAGILGGLGVSGAATGDWITEQALAAGERPYVIGLQLWGVAEHPDQLEATLAARPAMVSLSFGDPTPYVDRCHEAGIVVACQVGTTAAARAAVDAGVDVVVARGGEGGGHGVDQVATLPLLQSVLDVVDVPVLAAGGIASARGLAAVLAAGAAGAWIGTAFTTCAESTLPDGVVALLANAAEDQTSHSHVLDIAQRTGWPAEFGGRAVTNAFVEHWTGREDELAADTDELARFAAARDDRDPEVLPVWAGQGAGLLDGQRRPIADIVDDLAQAADLLRAAGASVRAEVG
ncbi:MAG: nitronate monooxygenase [Propionibacteriales bacterium]|nr:nitronate monooxygenase [Propionibacteriales bacterium]